MDLQFDPDTQRKFLQARQMGIPDEVNMKRAVAYQASKAKSSFQGQGNIPVVKAQGNVQGKKSSSLLDLLPLVGAVGGSFIPGAGTIVGGALGAGLGTLLKQGLKGDDFDAGEIAKETVLSGVGGVAGKGLGFIGGKALGKLGGSLTGLSDDLAIKGLRLNKSQLLGFGKKHGEDVATFLTKEGAVGKNAAKLASEHIEPLQNTFNQITKKSGLRLKPETFLKNLDEQADELIAAGGSENRALAEKIRQEGLFILQHDLGPVGNTVEKANKLRQTFASKVNWMDPEKSVVNTALSRALRKSNIEAAEQAGIEGLGEMGIKLGKFRDLEEIVKAQEQLGRGTLPAGITKWLAFGAGASGGPAGAIAALGANQVVNSPRVLGGAAQLARGVGERMGGIQPSSQLLTRMGLSTGAGSSLFTGGPQEQQPGTPGMQPGTDQQMQQPTGAQNVMQQMGGASPMGAGGGVDQQRQIIGAFMLQNAKSISDIKTAFEFMQPEEKEKSAGEMARDETLNLASNALQSLNSGSVNIGPMGVGSRIEDLKAKFNAGDPETLTFNAQVAAIKAAIARARAGTSFTPNEEKLLDRYTPTFGDSTQQVQIKLMSLMDFLQNANFSSRQ